MSKTMPIHMARNPLCNGALGEDFMMVFLSEMRAEIVDLNK